MAKSISDDQAAIIYAREIQFYSMMQNRSDVILKLLGTSIDSPHMLFAVFKETLFDVFTRQRDLPRRLRTNVSQQIAEAVNALHLTSIIHNRVNPKNVCLEYTEDQDIENAKVMLYDFGSAMVHQDTTSISSDGLFIGMQVYVHFCCDSSYI